MSASPESRSAPSRRTLLKAGVAGSLVLAIPVPHAQGATTDAQTHAAFVPDAFIRIDARGKTTLIMPQVEMGQGIYTGHAMILAEELDAAWSDVSVEAAPANTKLYANPLFSIQATGGSSSVRAFWVPLRKTAAAARAMLIAAAARQWKVDPASCTAVNGKVVHNASGKELSYGVLAAAAAKEPRPANPRLKTPAEFKLIGKPLKRLDTPDKVNGKAVFGIDIMPAGVKFATLAASPVLGGKVAHVGDRDTAMRVPGVKQIVVLDDLVAVVGDHFWAAKQGLAALDITWNEGANRTVDSREIWDSLHKASESEGKIAKARGDAVKALKEGDVYEAHYELPFLAHATMEPMNCTVQVTAAACDIWVGTQVCARAQELGAKVTGLPLEKVSVHNQLIGGGFGRRLDIDGIEKALRIAQKVSGPVKVVYTREEDIQHDCYRPIYYDRLSASLKDGKIDGWRHRISGSSIMARWFPQALALSHGIDGDEVDSAADEPYDIPNMRVEAVQSEPPGLVTGFWRGVGPNANVFAIESFMDELAHKAGKDPVDFRRAMLGKQPRLLHALNVVAERSGWGRPLPKRVGRGVCCQTSFASFIATVIEAEVDEQGEVLVRRVDTAVDTGIAINPDSIIAQLQGGVIFGLTAALYGEITIEKGRVQQSNFSDYRMLRIDQMPTIDVHLIKSGEAPGGIGEPGTTAAPPALRNAIYAATGIPLRRLPIDRDVLSGKKPLPPIRPITFLQPIRP